MGKPTGFLEYNRELPKAKEIQERIRDYYEFYLQFSNKSTERQAARCMDCGTPFCHQGCPLGNNIPEFNHMVYHENWQAAYQILISTNNFPEFTGRVCPAPCEGSCVLGGIEKPQVTIEHIEKSIVENAFKLGLVKLQKPQRRTGKKIAIIGSGPSGLAAAAQLNKVGHWVTVFERADKAGGLLRYGIPDFKLEKWVIDRRVSLMEQEGIAFRTNANVGDNIKTKDVLNEFDAIVLTGGSTIPRDLPIPGRELSGVHFAMDYLTQQNRRNAGEKIPKKQEIVAKNKNVVVIGGGDTGSDCVGTANRQSAKSVTQLELLDRPPEKRVENNPWPEWPNILRTSTSHEEGCQRKWNILTKEFIGDDKGKLKAIKIADIQWEKAKPGKRPNFLEIENSEREIPADLAFLAIGFTHPQHNGLLEQLKVELDERGNVKCNNYQTCVDKVFAAGDMRRGQSLVVWAISEGREAAIAVDAYLMGTDSILESSDDSLIRLSDK